MDWLIGWLCLKENFVLIIHYVCTLNWTKKTHWKQEIDQISFWWIEKGWFIDLMLIATIMFYGYYMNIMSQIQWYDEPCSK